MSPRKVARKQRSALQPRKRPFHETIITAIERCNAYPSTGHIFVLLGLIKCTHIPKGHDAIIESIQRFFDFPGAAKYGADIRNAINSLRNQKLVAEDRAMRRTFKVGQSRIKA